MQVNAISPGTAGVLPQDSVVTSIRRSFNQLGNALEEGDLTAAKKALEQFQSNAPSTAGRSASAVQAKVEALGQALDAGDVEAAQTAYADLKNTLSQRRNAAAAAAAARNDPPQRPPGPPPGGVSSADGASPAKTTSVSASTSAPEKAAKAVASGSAEPSSAEAASDPKDVNRDGEVTWTEQVRWQFDHPDGTAASSPLEAAGNNPNNSSVLNLLA